MSDTDIRHGDVFNISLYKHEYYVKMDYHGEENVPLRITARGSRAEDRAATLSYKDIFMRSLYFFPVMFLLVGCPLLYFGESLDSYMVYYLVEVENNTETDIVAFQAGQFYRNKNGEIDCFIHEEPKLTIPAHSSGEFSFGWRYYSTSSPIDESFNFVLNDGSRDYLFAGWREKVYQAPNAVVYGLGYGNTKKICFERDGKTETYSVKGTVDVYGKLRLVFNSPDDIQCGVVGNLTTDKESIFGEANPY